MIQLKTESQIPFGKRTIHITRTYPLFYATSVLDFLNHHEEIPQEKWSNIYFFGATVWIARACIASHERGYRIYDSTGNIVTTPRRNAYTNPFIAIEDTLSQRDLDLGGNTTFHHKPPREGRYEHVIIRHFSGAKRSYLYGVTEKIVPETHEEDFDITSDLAPARFRA